MPIDPIDPHILTAILLMLSVLGLYIATRMAMHAAISPGRSSPSRQALCQSLPIAVTSVAAVMMKHPGVAVAIVIGTSVAYLFLVLGMATYVAPMNETTSRPRIWGFVLVPILMAMLAGTGGVLTAWHAIMFLGLGVVLLGVWRDDLNAEVPPAMNDSSDARKKASSSQWLVIVAAVVLAAVAAVAAVHATASAAQQARLSSDVLAALSVLCPMLTLPSLRSAINVADLGDVNGAVSALVGTVLLNFCLILPVIVLLWYPTMSPAFNPVISASPDGNYYFKPSGLEYSSHFWQMETVALVTIGFAFIPISLGKITLTRTASAALVLVYAAYLATIAWSERGLTP